MSEINYGAGEPCNTNEKLPGKFDGMTIVQKLRYAAQEGREIIEPWQMDPNLYDEAADEIERLGALTSR